MKRKYSFTFLCAVVLLAGITPVHATVLLDQTTWVSSNRTSQSLPTRSGWFSSSNGSLSVSGGFMLMKVLTSSGAAISYFTPTSSSPPVQLNMGDTLTTTIKFNFTGVPPAPLTS